MKRTWFISATTIIATFVAYTSLVATPQQPATCQSGIRQINVQKSEYCAAALASQNPVEACTRYTIQDGAFPLCPKPPTEYGITSRQGGANTVHEFIIEGASYCPDDLAAAVPAGGSMSLITKGAIVNCSEVPGTKAVGGSGYRVASLAAFGDEYRVDLAALPSSTLDFSVNQTVMFQRSAINETRVSKLQNAIDGQTFTFIVHTYDAKNAIKPSWMQTGWDSLTRELGDFAQKGFQYVTKIYVIRPNIDQAVMTEIGSIETPSWDATQATNFPVTVNAELQVTIPLSAEQSATINLKPLKIQQERVQYMVMSPEMVAAASAQQ